jgi:ribonuclease inhibitor
MRIKRTATSYRLPGREIHSLEEFYDVISLKLSLPEHFGRNLDALWDVLTTDVKGPVEIIWEESAVSKRAMGPIYDRVSAMLTDVQKERDDFHVIFR